MPKIPRHPNKHVRAAIEYARLKGWRVEKAGPRAHPWGHLYCPHGQRGGCIIRVWSTPQNGQNLARRIRREIDDCTHHDG